MKQPNRTKYPNHIRQVTVPYPTDNEFNIFGDYTHLVCVQEGKEIKSRVRTIRESWSLENPKTELVKLLTQEQAELCLRALFFLSKKAVIEEGPKVR